MPYITSCEAGLAIFAACEIRLVRVCKDVHRHVAVAVSYPGYFMRRVILMGTLQSA
jgi:hypothetical protein